MLGNDSDGNDKKDDPWNINRHKKSPGLDEVLIAMLDKFRKGNGAPPFSTGISFGALIAIATFFSLWVLSGFYIVNPAEKAVILRFGQYEEVSEPGLHWMARFIEEKYVVDVQKIYSFSIDGDFLTKSSEQADLPSQAIEVTPADVSNNINDQSKNLVNVELNVQYRISDPRAYLFNMVNPNETVQQVAAGSLSAAIGQMKLDDVLTTGREFLSSKVFEATKQVLSVYNSGIEVVAVTLRKAQAPDQVRAAFNDVNRADQDKATYIQQAQAYASKTIPLAQGMAARTLADANGYQQKVVLTAQANIAQYQALLNVYSISPNVTRERMYLETMQSVLSHTTKVLLDYNAGNNLMYLPLDKLLKSKNESLPMQSAKLTQEVSNENN